jgi:DNA polymerase-3 subunit gamma/tau
LSKALYRKYRSKSLDEVVGQEHITGTLTKALESGSLSHAYLFTGPRGVGKTSVARILAHEVNKLEYTDESSHLDIIEIDAASNRRIDEIRDLRDKVHIAPTSSKYKVYIIDEVHMLTKEAFNALLKTLEEPPEHVIFILATTELNKLPDTIVSRTQHFKFNTISEDDVVSHLMSIASSEGLSLDPSAARLIAEHGGGSFRDSISLLDKVKTHSPDINIELVNSALGLASEKTVSLIIKEVKNGTPKSLIELLSEVYSSGINITALLGQLTKDIKRLYISTSASEYLALYKKIVDVSSVVHKELALEIALLEAQADLRGFKAEVLTDKTEKTETVKPDVVFSELPVSDTKIATPPKEDNKPEVPKPVNSSSELGAGGDVWEEILTLIKGKYNTLYSVLRMSDTKIEGDRITLQFKFPFHYKKINTQENINIIADTAKKVTGKQFKVECLATGDTKKSKKTNEIESINNIFGKTEVLES